MWVLAGDIGGTSTRLRLAEKQSDGWVKYPAIDYHSGEYEHLRDIVRLHMQHQGVTELASACFAVAGPVHKQSAKITNLPWLLKSQEMQQSLSIGSVVLINDFTSVAHGLSELDDDDLITLQYAQQQRDGAIAILGAGTGLGTAFVKPFDDQQVIIDGEGGHVDFAPRNGEEMSLMQYWLPKLGRVSYETFLSGKGLVRIFDFYRQQQAVSVSLHQAMDKGDPAAAISFAALHDRDPLALRSLHAFIRIYAAQAANLALLATATGGVYLAGGIAPRIINLLQGDEFIQVFNDKPPMQELLATIPVHVIMNTRVGLKGALKIARQLVS